MVMSHAVRNAQGASLANERNREALERRAAVRQQVGELSTNDAFARDLFAHCIGGLPVDPVAEFAETWQAAGEICAGM
eukprot:552995-Alexandrium_andersonii.AAC.1